MNRHALPDGRFADRGCHSVGVAIKQTNIARTMAAKQDEHEREIHDWQLKHEAVATQLVKITPQVMMQEPGHNSFIMLYPTIFPDAKFRQAVETYIVELDGTKTSFIPRKPNPHELRSPALRQTVARATELLDAFRKDHPDIAASHMPL